jgi:hypothetical protein
MNQIRLSALIVLLAFPTLLFANEIYQSVDEQGNIVYSDSPPETGAEPISLPNLNIEPAVVPRVRLSPAASEGPEPIEIWISSPDNEGVINPGALSFSVAGATSRNLAENEYAQLLVNGSPHGDKRKNLNWSVGNLFRGEYLLQLQIFRSDKILVSSAVTKIYVQRAFVR